MHKTNFLVGMGIGMAVGSYAGAMIKSDKKNPKKVVSKTLKTMGNVVDAVSNSMGM